MLEAGDVLVRRADGRQDTFTEDPERLLGALGRYRRAHQETDGTFKLTALDRTVYGFDESGRIASISDDHGQETTYAYDANGRLATISDPSGQTLPSPTATPTTSALFRDSTGRQ